MNTEASGDKQLLEAAKRGDRPALEELLKRHQGQVYRFAMKMCRGPQDAEDVLQETLLSAARSLPDFRGGSSLSTWLYTIARSYCIKKQRVGKFTPERVHGADAESLQLRDPGQLPDEVAAGQEVEEALRQAVMELEPMYREVLVLRDMEGLTAPEVAEALGVSVDAVKSRLHRARKSVRDALVPVLQLPSLPAVDGGKSCPDVLALFSQHLEDEISAEACSDMERHLQACPRCKGTCDSLRKTLLLCRTAPAAEVPLHVQKAVRAAIAGFLSTPA